MRLIDANDLIDWFESLAHDDWNKGTGTTWARAFEESANMVDGAPAIDAVPVVRCRDCKWYKTMYCKMDRWTDLVTVYMAKEDDYCSYGEKWEGAKMYERWKDE